MKKTKNASKCVFFYLLLFWLLSIITSCKSTYISVVHIDTNVGIYYDLGINEFEFIQSCNAIYVKSRSKDTTTGSYSYILWQPKRDTIINKQQIREIRKEITNIAYRFPRKFEYILPAFYSPRQVRKMLKKYHSTSTLSSWINADNARMAQVIDLTLYEGQKYERDTTLLTYSRSKLLGINKRIVFHKKNSTFNDTIYTGHQWRDEEKWGPRPDLMNSIIILNGRYCLLKGTVRPICHTQNYAAPQKLGRKKGKP